MIKNKLYPYIEKYINDYLWGFTKEQLRIGILNGIISLDNIHLRSDMINSELNKSEIPFWLKGGTIGKIKVGCSLMNFIGEKPLEVLIQDIHLVFCPSYKYIFKNKRKPVSDIELKEEYDPIEYNSNNIFENKVKIYDGSVLNPSNCFNFYQDKTELSKLINQILTLCIKFYTMKPYAINATVSNIHIRFEDDELVYNSKNIIAFGGVINSIQLSLGAEGMLKKNSFMVEEMRIYYDNSPSIFIPTEYFLKSLNDQGDIIEQSYYQTIYKINFKRLLKDINSTNIIELFMIKGNIGINSASKNQVNIFENSDLNNMTAYFNILIDDPLTITIIPDAFRSLNSVALFINDFKTLKYVNEFRPLYAPLSSNRSLTAYFLNEEDINYQLKKKRIVRDWLFYFFWFKEFKKVFKYKTYKNNRSQAFNNAFNRYMNILVMNNKEENVKKLAEDIQIIQSINTVKIYCINQSPTSNKSGTTKDNGNQDECIKSETNIQIKQLRLYVYRNISNTIQSNSRYCLMTIDSNSLTCSLSKSQTQFGYSFKNLIIETEETHKTLNKEIPKHEDLVNQKMLFKMKTKTQSTNFYSFSANNPTTELNKHVHHPNMNIHKYNTSNGFGAGLKISPLVDETKAIQKSNIKTFKQQARSAKRMKILCETLHMSRNANVYINPVRPMNSQQKDNESFTMTLLNINDGNKSLIQQEKEESRYRTEVSISKAIKDYNNKKVKIKNKSVNNSISLHQSVIQGNEDNGNNNGNILSHSNSVLNQSNSMINHNNNIFNHNNSIINPNSNIFNHNNGTVNMNINHNAGNHNNNNSNNIFNKLMNKKNTNNNYKSIYSIVNNKIKQIKDDFHLSLLDISLNESKEYAFSASFKKQNSSKCPDSLSIKIGSVRMNVFATYLKELFEISESYNIELNLGNKVGNEQGKDMIDKRYLYLMKKYIYERCITNLRDNPNELLLKYATYIKEKCLISYFNDDDEISQEVFDLGYFFSHYSSEGLQMNFNYDRIDVLCYNRDVTRNELLGRVKIPPINFKLELSLSNIFVQLFDFEFEINDYDSITDSIHDVIDIFKGKFLRAKKAIDPALQGMKELIIKEKEDQNLKKSYNISILPNNSSYVFAKTLTISNKPPPVNIKIVNNNNTAEQRYYDNRPVTMNNTIHNNINTGNNNHNNHSLFRSTERENNQIIPKNTIF